MSQAIKQLATITVGTGPAVAVDTRSQQNLQFRSIRLQADDNNTGKIYYGDSTVTSSNYAGSLAAHEWVTITGDAIVGTEIYVVASAAGQIVHPSGL